MSRKDKSQSGRGAGQGKPRTASSQAKPLADDRELMRQIRDLPAREALREISNPEGSFGRGSATETTQPNSEGSKPPAQHGANTGKAKAPAGGGGLANTGDMVRDRLYKGEAIAPALQKIIGLVANLPRSKARTGLAAAVEELAGAFAGSVSASSSSADTTVRRSEVSGIDTVDNKDAHSIVCLLDRPLTLEKLKYDLSQALEDIFSQLPADAHERLDAIDNLNGVYRRAVRPHLQEAIQGVLQDKGGSTAFSVVQTVSRKVNKALADTNHAILDPSTSRPASVVPHRRNSQAEDGSFYRLQDGSVGEKGYKFKSGATKNLSSLQVIDRSEAKSVVSRQGRAGDTRLTDSDTP
jgi:hypothetical protein